MGFLLWLFDSLTIVEVVVSELLLFILIFCPRFYRAWIRNYEEDQKHIISVKLTECVQSYATACSDIGLVLDPLLRHFLMRYQFPSFVQGMALGFVAISAILLPSKGITSVIIFYNNINSIQDGILVSNIWADCGYWVSRVTRTWFIPLCIICVAACFYLFLGE